MKFSDALESSGVLRLGFATVALRAISKGLRPPAQGWCVIKLPISWQRESTLLEIVECSIKQAFRTSQRIVAIVFTWDEYAMVNNGGLFLKKVRDYVNARSKLFRPDVLELVKTMGRARNPEWVQFHQFVEAQLKGMSR